MRNLSCLVLLLSVSFLLADDSWPQFRGPNGTGISKATDLPTKWDEKTNIAWKTAIHDKGWSSPVVFGKQVWLTTALSDGKAHWAVCVDRDSGKIVHDIKVFETPKVPYFFMKDYNSHASPSPAVEQGRVYVHFGSSGTACIDTTSGKVIWSRKDLPCNHWRAPGSSPVIWEDLLFLTFDGHDKQYVVALEKATGKTVWSKDRDIDYKTDDGDRKKAYCTPAIIEVNGKPQLVDSAAVATISYEPRTGKEIWKVYHGGMNVATVPQYGQGLVFLTSGDVPAKLLAVKPTGTGDVTKTHVEWVQTKEVPSRPTPVLVGDLLFIVGNTGIARCMEAKTGKQIWTRRITGSYYSSPIVADGKLYICNMKGQCYVLTADREGKVLGVNALDAGIRATPAAVGKALYVRTDTHLYRIEKK